MVNKVLYAIATFVSGLKSTYEKEDLTNVAIIEAKVIELSNNLITSLIASSPDIVDASLKALSSKYISLPQKYDVNTINTISSEYSIFKNYNMAEYSKKELRTMKNIILQGKYQKLTDQQIRTNLIESLDMSRRRALLIARAETQALEQGTLDRYYMNAEVKSLYTKVWDAVNDAAVRPDHEAMDGKKADKRTGLFYSDKWGNIRGPADIPYPDRYNCRCSVRLIRK